MTSSSPPPPPPTSSSSTAADLVPPWLKSLPLAPEFHPTPAEFADPIAYILRIEPTAAPFGICKIIPPYPAPSKKSTLSNLSRSFSSLPPPPPPPPDAPTPTTSTTSPPAPTFSTRHQQVGLCPRRPRPALKPVWHSGDRYTLPQFEAKAAASRRSLLSKFAPQNSSLSKQQQQLLPPLELEALFWRAAADRPITVEYANDMPGSGFSPFGRPRTGTGAAPMNVGETAWNMRGVARSPGSLLRFMREEIPGVTSPMIYVAMMFSWFAWHVEDHELHSLNYLHFGAGKTWYGVPRDAALAFEEVVRVHGYGGEVNPLATFAILGEKTTVMSPEVFVGSGIPCCRLVQNAGEFVVTFPGSYHCGFSHGFNCGEASNIATPEWLKVAKEAAIRRASINRPPMVSHYQLLYELALSMRARNPSSGGIEPRSSRLKDKKKGEGEHMVKKTFVQNVIENNQMLSLLLNDGSSCIILPPNAHDGPVLSNSLSRSQIKTKSRLSQGLCSREEALEASECLYSNGTLSHNTEIRSYSGFSSSKESSLSVCSGKKFPPATCTHDSVGVSCSSDSNNAKGDKGDIFNAVGLLDQGLLSCVTCGILSFSCVAVIKPREATAKYLMSADYGLLNDQFVGSGGTGAIDTVRTQRIVGDILGECEKHVRGRADYDWYGCGNYSVQASDHSEVIFDAAHLDGTSALDLLVSAYGDPSDSDDEVLDENVSPENFKLSHDSSKQSKHVTESQNTHSSNICYEGAKLPSAIAECQHRTPSQSSQYTGSSDVSNGPKGVRTRNKYQLKMVLSEGFQPKDIYSTMEKKVATVPSSSIKTLEEPPEISGTDFGASCNNTTMTMGEHRSSAAKMNNSTAAMMRSDKDSSRMHVFCLDHAIEVEKQLQSMGGVHIILLCHPEYPKIDAEAKLLAEEMKIDYDWKDVHFREANKKDKEKIQAALWEEEAIPTNSDWAVKLGINLYYSANLAKSPLYSKQMPYNKVIYRAFGCNSPNNSPVKLKAYGRRQGRQKKIVFAGRWCGKVWMSNQVHPYLARRIESREVEQTEGVHSPHLDQKPKAELEADHSSQVAPTKRKRSSRTDARKSSRKRRKKPLEKADTKKPTHTQEDDSKKTKDVTEASTSQGGMVLRSSSRIAKRANKMKSIVKEEDDGPTTRLRKRPPKQEKIRVEAKKQNNKKVKAEKTKAGRATTASKDEGEYTCDIEGCSMSFNTKQELSLHKRDICPVKGCGRKFFSHKYLVQHRKVHIDDRPLECPWKGCSMTFKWPWARTEHIRVHTGDRPYVCREPGCGQTFRFVSDFSRHKRKTGHSAKKAKR